MVQRHQQQLEEQGLRRSKRSVSAQNSEAGSFHFLHPEELKERENGANNDKEQSDIQWSGNPDRLIWGGIWCQGNFLCIRKYILFSFCHFNFAKWEQIISGKLVLEKNKFDRTEAKKICWKFFSYSFTLQGLDFTSFPRGHSYLIKILLQIWNTFWIRNLRVRLLYALLSRPYQIRILHFLNMQIDEHDSLKYFEKENRKLFPQNTNWRSIESSSRMSTDCKIKTVFISRSKSGRLK